MRRRLFNIFAALSLLLCVATVVLWVRSYHGADSVSRLQVTGADTKSADSRIHKIQWSQGQMRFVLAHQVSYFNGRTVKPPAETPTRWSYFRYGPGYIGEDAPITRSIWGRLGFGMWRRWLHSSIFSSRQQVWAVPLWFVVTAFAAPPALWALRRYLRRRRREAGRCAACGYDLRASPERCPECGTVSHGGAAAA